MNGYDVMEVFPDGRKEQRMWFARLDHAERQVGIWNVAASEEGSTSYYEVLDCQDESA